ncbi:MAG TPA: 50S ribosomal protein L32 [Acholeplasmataceae bacterium]|nr:50S ribosomal protein L32 [Acholeplasmataceae bacterium]
MAIVPQRRISKTRKRKRRTHFKLDLPGMMVCPNCGEMKRGHVVCGKCGYYDGKLVKEIKVKSDEEDTVVETKAEGKAKAKAEKKAKAKAKKEEDK